MSATQAKSQDALNKLKSLLESTSPTTKEDLHAASESALLEAYTNIYGGYHSDAPELGPEAIKNKINEDLKKIDTFSPEQQIALKNAQLCAEIYLDTETLWRSTYMWVPRHPKETAMLVSALAITGATLGTAAPGAIPAALGAMFAGNFAPVFALVVQYYTTIVVPFIANTVFPALLSGEGIGAILGILGIGAAGYASRKTWLPITGTATNAVAVPLATVIGAPLIPLIAIGWGLKSLAQAAYNRIYPQRYVDNLCTKYSKDFASVETSSTTEAADQDKSNAAADLNQQTRRRPGSGLMNTVSKFNPIGRLTGSSENSANINAYQDNIKNNPDINSNYIVGKRGQTLNICPKGHDLPDVTVQAKENSLIMDVYKNNLIPAAVSALPNDMNSFTVECQKLQDATNILSSLQNKYGDDVTIRFESKNPEIVALSVEANTTRITASKSGSSGPSGP